MKEGEDLEEVLEVNPRWCPRTKTFSVAKKLENDLKSWKRVKAVIMFFLRWKKFNLARFHSVSSSSRQYWGSRFVGVDQWAKILRADSTFKNYYINGYEDKGSKDVKFFLSWHA